MEKDLVSPPSTVSDPGAPAVALAFAAKRNETGADAFRSAWPDGPVHDLSEAERIWADSGIAPDAMLLFADGPSDAQMLERVERLRARIRAAGADMPVIVETRKGADLALARLPDAFVAPSLGANVLAARIRETMRLSVRMEEARLRRLAFGPLPHAPLGDRGGLMVAGAGQAAGNALELAGLALPIEGALSADAVCLRLAETAHHALFFDMPIERTSDILGRVSSDPRLVSLPVMAMCADPEEAEVLLALGCSDAVSRDIDPADLAMRLRVLLLAGARRQLSDTLLRRFRTLYLEDCRELPAPACDAYLARLGAVLSAHGRAPLVRTLEDLHPGPLPVQAANDDPLAAAVGDPVRSTILAASREEDFVARVAGRGDMIVLRDAQALAGLKRRVGAIIATTSFV